MKICITKYFFRLLYMGVLVLFVTSACTNRLSKVIKPSDLPADLATTGLLVQKFEYQDPKIYDSFAVINTDSLQARTGFKFEAESDLTDKEKKEAEREEKKMDQAREKEHPLIVQTNKNLDEYNRKLEKAMRGSKYPYKIVGKEEINTNSDYADVDKYRYMLIRRPELHCYTDPSGVTQLSYRYVHQFYDRKTNTYFTDIEIFSPQPWKTTKAIVASANKNLRQ